MFEMLSDLIRRWARTAAADRRGGIATMGAVVMLPLAVLGFSAVEYHRMTMVRGQVQKALDAAALAVALSYETDPVALDAFGTTVLAGNLAAPATIATLEDATFVENDGDVDATARVRVKPIIAHMLTGSDVTLTVESSVARLGQKIEVALVLDNTYSMLTNDRIGILKTAAENFVATLQAPAARTRVPDALKISVVPFSATVKVGATNSAGAARNATNSPWLDWNALSPTHRQTFNAPLVPAITPAANRFSLFGTLGTTWQGCVESRPAPYDVTDTPADASNPATLFVPYFAPDEPDTPDWGAAYYINNYIADASVADFFTREKNVEKYHATPVVLRIGAMGSGYEYGPNFGCRLLHPIVPLSTDLGPTGKVRTAIRNLTLVGDTNIPLGAIWGWHTLSPNSPFNEKGAAYGPQVRKIMVLMTDGDNTMGYVNDSRLENWSWYSGLGYIWQNRLGITSGDVATRRAKMDERLAAVCANMKAAGIEIYTVRVEVATTSPVMQGCASDTSKYYNVAAAAQLTQVFQDIATSILVMRVRD